MKLDDFITKHFKFREALYLPQWDICVFPEDEILFNIIQTAEVMEEIRKILGDKPISITSWYRPPKYNEKINGAKKSMHMQGLAVDFRVKGQDCDKTMSLLVPYLEALDIRMEAKFGRSWVHIDLKRDVKLKPENRFFK